VPEDTVEQAVAEGALEKVLEDWCEPFLAIICTIPAENSIPLPLRN
jgi:hypothetical protein